MYYLFCYDGSWRSTAPRLGVQSRAVSSPIQSKKGKKTTLIHFSESQMEDEEGDFLVDPINTDSAIELGNDVLPCIDNVKDLIVDFSGVDDDPNLRIFICPYCAHSFAYKHVLERHVKQIHEKHFSVVHEDFKPFYCSECNFRALKAFRVKTHIQKNHGGLGTAIHEASLKPRSVRHIPKILNRFRHQVQEEATKVPFYCPYCDFKSESQIEIGDHSTMLPNT